MKLDIGVVERQATSTSTFVASMTAVNFSYTVTLDDVDTDGIIIKADSITNSGNWRRILPFGVIDR